MALEQTINDHIKDAMRAKDKDALRALREIKSAILLAKTDGSGKDLDEGSEMKLLEKLLKQHQDSFEIYQKNNRPEQAAQEEKDIAIIKKYLPEAMSPEDLAAAVKAIIEDTGAESMKDMGKVMGIASKKLAGKADGKSISACVRNLLN